MQQQQQEQRQQQSQTSQHIQPEATNVHHTEQTDQMDQVDHMDRTDQATAVSQTAAPARADSHAGSGWRQRLRHLLRHLLRQRALYIGLVCGILLTLLLGFLLYLLFSPYGISYTPPATPQSGNVAIAIDHEALEIGMQAALQKVQPQLPITIQHVSTTLHDGDQIDVRVDGQSVVGITPSLVVTLSPTVAANGSIDFKVQRVTLNGFNASLGGAVNSAIEQAINRQFANYSQGTPIQGLHYQIIGVDTTSDALVITARLTSSSSGYSVPVMTV
jgi:hypothetical protein